MTSELAPNAAQQAVVSLPICDVLVIAPPGCGKTEALAWRLEELVRTGGVRLPRKALGITFSNRAKRNLAARVRRALGHGWREMVSVTNFHGLAARVIAAHGARVGVSREAGFPTRAWQRQALRKAGETGDNREFVAKSLREAKAGGVSDDEVLARLASIGDPVCLRFEHARRAANRLDFDDLIRHAIRLLRDPEVAALYAAHFAAVVVDEVQDLTADQLEMVTALGTGKITFAGDRSQAIFGFAGADVDHTFSTIDALPALERRNLDLSYRSSPRVLACTNVLSSLVGGPQLRSAFPERWPGGGETELIRSASWAVEARQIQERLAALVERTPDASVGVISRRTSRLSRVRDVLSGKLLPVQDWTVPTHVPEVAELLHRALARVGAHHDSEAAKFDELRARCLATSERHDIETCDQLDDALAQLQRRVDAGETLAAALRDSRQSQDPEKPVGPGVHLLNGHIGKGQEFDWVFVVGLEEGHVPDFRATTDAELAEELRVLLVMASRAKHKLVFTFSATAETRAGPRTTVPSRWLAPLEPTCR